LEERDLGLFGVGGLLMAVGGMKVAVCWPAGGRRWLGCVGSCSREGREEKMGVCSSFCVG